MYSLREICSKVFEAMRLPISPYDQKIEDTLKRIADDISTRYPDLRTGPAFGADLPGKGLYRAQEGVLGLLGGKALVTVWYRNSATDRTVRIHDSSISEVVRQHFERITPEGYTFSFESK